MSDQNRDRPSASPSRLAGGVITHLTDEIVAGNLAPGTRLPTEHRLMADFGLSRTVVREAIAALRAEGLVETRRGSGAFVAADPRRRPFRIDPEGLHSIAEVLNVMELRIAVEVEAAGLAAQNRSKGELGEIRRAHLAFGAAIGDGSETVSTDFAFHVATAMATGNPYFHSFLTYLGRLVIPRRSIRLGMENPRERIAYLQRVWSEHEEIIEAIEARDVSAARRAMRTHLRRGRERYRRAAEGDGRL
jgi:DNA-binding FadR family transcriptional regulator